MNKRIEELAYDADLLDKFRYGYFDPKLQKFAELIVRECCQKLENDGMVEVAMEMKQHFGVK